MESDDKVILGAIVAISLGLLIWTCVLVWGIKKDIVQIKKSILNIQGTLKPIEHINDPTGLIQHMGNTETNFHNTKVPVFDLYEDIEPLTIETDISKEANQ